MSNDDLREIEDAVGTFGAMCHARVADQVPARDKLLALIRQKLPQTDAEHEAKVEAWWRDATSFPDHDEHDFFHVQRCVLQDGVRLMRARPAIEPHTFTGLPDTTYEKLVAKEKAAGELLRAAKEAANWLLECDQDDDAQKLYAAIGAAERAGVR